MRKMNKIWRCLSRSTFLRMKNSIYSTGYRERTLNSHKWNKKNNKHNNCRGKQKQRIRTTSQAQNVSVSGQHSMGRYLLKVATVQMVQRSLLTLR